MGSISKNQSWNQPFIDLKFATKLGGKNKMFNKYG